MIPEQLQGYELIRVCRPKCKSHSGCSSQGKRPVTSVEDREKPDGIRKWLLEGGNYGIPAHSGNDLVIFDVDSVGFERIVTEELPKDTFTVRSGGDGFGKHLYYRCWDFERNADYKDPKGSVRSNNYHAVGPGSDHVSGGRYEVMKNRPIREVSLSDLQTVLDRLDERDGRENVNSGAGARADINTQGKEEGPLWFVQDTDRREELRGILKDPDPTHSERLWFVGFLYSACGLYQNEITELLLENSRWATDVDITRKQVQGVANQNQRGTHYSSYSSDDVVSRGKETTEDDYFPDGVSMSDSPEFTTMEEVQLLNGSEDGDRFKSLAVVEGETDEETWEYLSLRKGRVRETKTVEGDTVLANSVEEQNSLGVSPDNIGNLITALEELQEQIE